MRRSKWFYTDWKSYYFDCKYQSACDFTKRSRACNGRHKADDDFLAFSEDLMPWLKVTYEFR